MAKSRQAVGVRREPTAGQGSAGREDTPSVGRVLRRAREHSGLAIREVERRLGRSSAYLSQIERGIIRQPDPVVLLELAELYRLDFMTLAKWAGWAESADTNRSDSATLLVRRVLELDDAQRAEVLKYIEGIARDRRK